MSDSGVRDFKRRRVDPASWKGCQLPHLPLSSRAAFHRILVLSCGPWRPSCCLQRPLAQRRPTRCPTSVSGHARCCARSSAALVVHIYSSCCSGGPGPLPRTPSPHSPTNISVPVSRSVQKLQVLKQQLEQLGPKWQSALATWTVSAACRRHTLVLHPQRRLHSPRTVPDPACQLKQRGELRPMRQHAVVGGGC